MRTRIFGYHEIVEGTSDSSYSISAVRFAEQLQLFTEFDGNNSLSVEITFDDGHASNYLVAAPILREYSRTGVFFVTAGWIAKRDGFMQWAQLSDLILEGHKVQSHGLTHRFLTQLKEAELVTELHDSKAMLEDQLQEEISEISLPGGRYNDRVLGRCVEAGYRKIYSSVPWNKIARTRCIELRGRLIVNNRMSQEWFRRYLRGDRSPYLTLLFVHAVREVAKAALGDNFYHNAWSVISGRRGKMANCR
jgi:peptidoglycan/xylan/chitin deacetylase (PgdA/CDA1 family)